MSDGKEELKEDKGAALEMPHRHIEIALELDADDWQEAAKRLEQIALDIWRGRYPHDQISAGWASSYHCKTTINPDQTGDNYREQNRLWVEAQRRGPQRLVPVAEGVSK